MKLPAKVQFSLILVLLFGGWLLTRWVMHGWWGTVAAPAMLVAGAIAAFSGRTWGIGLTLLGASAFIAAYLLGMAPPEYLAVGYVGALPFVLTWKPMAFFDRPAAKLFAALAIAGGIACAIAWHEIGSWVVANLER